MIVSPSALRAAFPAFANTTTYPDATIEAWDAMASASPMGSWYAAASSTEQMLLVAHMGALFTQQATGSNAQGGAVVSASEGSVSSSFVAPPVKTGLQYYLSSTSYGQALWAMINIEAAGGQYVGGLPERSAFRKVGGVFC